MAHCFAETGGFIGDTLLAFGRNLSFALDPAFMTAFRDAEPSDFEACLIWRLHLLCWGAKRGMELEGDLVEAACYKGFSARVIANFLNLGESDRTYWLYDAFEDSPTPLPETTGSLHDLVKRRFADLGNVRVVKGVIPDILNQHAPRRIAFMHIDMNNVEAEIGALDVLFDRMVPGSVVIFDDYGWASARRQKDAADRWFAARGKMVAELPTGQGMVIR